MFLSIEPSCLKRVLRGDELVLPPQMGRSFSSDEPGIAEIDQFETNPALAMLRREAKIIPQHDCDLLENNGGLIQRSLV